MRLWLFFLSTFLILVLATAGALAYLDLSVFPTFLDGAQYVEVTYQTAIVAAAVLALIGVLFLLLGRSIARPVRLLTQAVDAFTTDGQPIALEEPRTAPDEIRGLTRSFITLMGNVIAAHHRDTEVSRVKSDFISTAAHQFRTPLTSVRWALEALEKSELTEDQRGLVKNAVDKSHELVNIVGTLLDISAIESGKYKYRFAAVDMPSVIAEVVRDYIELAKMRSVAVSYQPGDPLPAIRADRERVKWVLGNLVENAIRYTPSGGTVRIAADRGPGRVFITVRDTGIGIDPHDRGNIFERFYRGGNAVSKESEGNGLGLYIARTIATDHGGDLNFAANAEGPGTTFTLSLPLAAGAPTP